MIENYKNAIEEFKRVDHLFYVTLKYTRTVDVIRSMIERLISTFEYAIDSALLCMKEEKIIGDIPENPVGKGGLLIEKCGDDDMEKFLERYLMLRRLMRAPYTKREEFRRHVTMIVDFEGEKKEIDIDLLQEYYDDTRKFLTYVKELVKNYQDD